MEEIIAAIVVFLISFISFIISIRSFKKKGFLLNNAFIFASEQERKKMDKVPYYRQSGVVFLLIGIIFLLIGFQTLLAVGWILYAEAAVTVITIIYAFISSIAIEKRIDKKLNNSDFGGKSNGSNKKTIWVAG